MTWALQGEEGFALLEFNPEALTVAPYGQNPAKLGITWQLQQAGKAGVVQATRNALGPMHLPPINPALCLFPLVRWTKFGREGPPISRWPC